MTYMFIKLASNLILDSTQLFREDGGAGMPLLREIWLRREGIAIIEQVISPLIERIYSYTAPLEVF